MSPKTLPMDVHGSNPKYAAQLALYMQAALRGMNPIFVNLEEPGFEPPRVFEDLTPRPDHRVESLAALLTERKDEVIDGVRALTWQQRFLDSLPMQPYVFKDPIPALDRGYQTPSTVWW